MVRTILGVVAELDGRDLAMLRRAAETRTRIPDDLESGEPYLTVHLNLRGARALVELTRVEHGWLLASRIPDQTPSSTTGELSGDPASASGLIRARLNGPLIERLTEPWESPRPDPQAPGSFRAEQRGTVFEIEQPLVASPIRLDDAIVADRFARGMRNPFDTPMTRDLAAERLFARLPSGFDVSRPSGLLVWVSPTPEGRPPQHLHKAADALGLVCVSAENAGNDRTPLDRIQLTLDAVSTASSHVWIDPERVYAIGMSGGGRIASMLWACFPDVFKGAVSIVGMNSHHPIPTGKSNQYWPPSHKLPAPARARSLRTNRLAAVSGPRDYNFREMQARVGKLRRERLAARLFDHADLGHTMASPQQITQALAWVDAAVSEKREKVASQAQPILDRYLSEYGSVSPPDQRAADQLERVTVLAPWTDPAWRAVRLLGYVEPALQPEAGPATTEADTRSD